tara:strand:+ start:122 stop:487 length:366 start_codon:yes stop_codon:yes gene_type:complete
MADLAVTNTFSAGTTIVAADMNQNFTDIVSWSTTTPTLSTAGSATTVAGTLNVTQLLTATLGVYLPNNLYIAFEGSTADAHETFLYATDPTADRAVYLPNASGTLTTADDSNGVIGHSVFN